MRIVEIDVRMTKDGHPVVLHDEGLGRATDIGEMLGRGEPPSAPLISGVYSPFTGKGYNPPVKSLPWQGCVEKLRLKEEHGFVWYDDSCVSPR